MRDIHSHIMYGIDDGSRSLEESIKLLKIQEKKGITDIILTPHYIENTDYTCSIQRKNDIINELQKYTTINLYTGNEVYITENIKELLEKEKISTLNNSRYLLLELPMNNKIVNVEDILYSLIRINIVPIIAHPERYSYVQDDIKYLNNLKEMGILFQGNYESLFGKYGEKAKKSLRKLIKLNYITFLGSDMHRLDYEYHQEKLEKKLLRITKNKNMVEDLISNNILKVINNEEIDD